MLWHCIHTWARRSSRRMSICQPWRREKEMSWEDEKEPERRQREDCGTKGIRYGVDSQDEARSGRPIRAMKLTSSSPSHGARPKAVIIRLSGFGGLEVRRNDSSFHFSSKHTSADSILCHEFRQLESGNVSSNLECINRITRLAAIDGVLI